MEWFFLSLFTALAIAGGFGVVISRNAVHSALFLLLNFASMAMLYLMLGAQFLAMAQVMVYAGAIVVLFIFTVMLIGNEPMQDIVARARPVLRAVAMALATLFLGGALYALLTAPQKAAVGLAEQGSVQSVGKLMYTRFMLPFELASVLLLAAMIGAIVLARRAKPPLGTPEE